MPRKTREFIAGRSHHLMLRGNNRRRIFSYSSDYDRFLKYLRDALGEYRVAVHNLAMMSNHVHLNASPDTKHALSNFIKKICQRYAQYRNKKRRSTGKLFEERFKCVPIKSESAMAIVSVYIDLNPFRAGLINDPRDGVWSTFARHVGVSDRARIPDDVITESAWYLGLGRDLSERARKYLELARQFYSKGIVPEHSAEIERIEKLSMRGDGPLPERPDRKKAS